MENMLHSSLPEKRSLLTAFTFIANYKGGVYVRQVAAKNHISACTIWAEQVVSKQDIPKLNGDAFLKAFRDDMELQAPVPLQNTSNVWAFSVANRRAFMLVNIVKTAESAETPAPLPARF